MKAQIKMFALARQLVGEDTVELELPNDATIASLRAALERQCPDLSALLPHLLISINAEYAGDEQPIPPDAEIACIPPVSGG